MTDLKNLLIYLKTHLIKFIEEEKIENNLYYLKINKNLFFYYLNFSSTLEEIFIFLDLKTENQRKYLYYLHQSDYFKNHLLNLDTIINLNSTEISIKKGRELFLDNFLKIYSSPRVENNFLYHNEYFLNFPFVKKLMIFLNFLQEHYKQILLIVGIILIIKFIFEQFRL